MSSVLSIPANTHCNVPPFFQIGNKCIETCMSAFHATTSKLNTWCPKYAKQRINIQRWAKTQKTYMKIYLHECLSGNNMQDEYIMHRDSSQMLLAPKLPQFGSILDVPINLHECLSDNNMQTEYIMPHRSKTYKQHTENVPWDSIIWHRTKQQPETTHRHTIPKMWQNMTASATPSHHKTNLNERLSGDNIKFHRTINQRETWK